MRRIGALALAVLWMICLLIGCNRIVPIPDGDSSLGFAPVTEAAHFARQPLWKTAATGQGGVAASSPEVTLTQEELLTYESPYQALISDVYKRQLDTEQVLIYQTILYAADNGYPYLDFPLRWADGQDNLWDLYSHVALDSPLVESNVRQSDWVAGDGCLQFCNPAFGSAFLAKKQQALEKARAIVAAMPASHVSDEDKARYCYEYLITHCVYESYADNTICQSYLYDALCEGHGICDGFSNALTLLLQCCGIPAFEKMRLGSMMVEEDSAADVSAADDGDIILEKHRQGHVWVSAAIDGAYYNLDPTYDIGDESHCQIALTPYWFLFPDGDADHGSVFAGNGLPACKQGEAGVFVRDITASQQELEEDVIDRAAAFMEQHCRGDDAYVRIWFAGGAETSRVKRVTTGLYKRLRRGNWSMGFMMTQQQGDVVAISFCPAYAADSDLEQTALQMAARLQDYNDAGYGHAVVQFNIEEGEGSGRELLFLLQQEIRRTGLDTWVYGEAFDGGDERFCYWQYWLPQPSEMR